MKKSFLLILSLILLPFSLRAEGQIVISTAKGDVTITPLADNAVRVRHGAESTLPEMFYLNAGKTKVKHRLTENATEAMIVMNKMIVIVDKESGTPQFFSLDGKHQRAVLKEQSHSLTPAKLYDTTTNIASLTLDSPSDEFLYGLGQFQDGYVNVRGLSRRLTQVNTQISIPMILSSRGYALLWNNYGMTEFNPGVNSVKMVRKGEGKVTEVNVTSTEGGKKEVRQDGVFETVIDIPETGDYSFLLDVGQTMARKLHLSVDGKPFIDIQNVWLPPTASTIQHLTKGKHVIVSELTKNDKPTLYYSRVENTTRFVSPVAEAVDYTVFVGSADECITSYRSLTGHSPMQPLWAFGYVHCRERFHSSDEILSTANTFRQKQLPMDVIVQDWQWWGKYGWNAFKFDEQYYPDPKLLVDSLHSLGARLMLSVWSKIDENSEVGKEAKAKGYYIPGTTWIDFFNPEAADFYWENFNTKLLQPYKIDCYWQDATEPENDDLLGRKINGGKEYGEVYRNVYPNLVSKVVYEGCKQGMADNRTFILTRSGAPGIHRYGSFLWSGDVGNDWQTLRLQLAGGLGLMAAGHPWWTYDAGGFFRPGGQYTDKNFHECFLRWLQMATFLPMMRVHGYMTDTEFWRFGPDVEREAKRQLTLRYSLLPYIYSTSYQVTKGYTMMRPLVMDFADDPQALALNDQYMFGPSLLIAPVLEPSAKTQRHVYLPANKGGWYDFHSGTHYASTKTKVAMPVTLSQIPVFVKAGSIIPTAQPMQTTAEYNADNMTITVYPGADAEFTLYEDAGTDYTYEQGQCSTIAIKWDDASRTLTIGKRKGSFAGMLTSRTFRVNVVGQSAQSVAYSGSSTKVKL